MGSHRRRSDPRRQARWCLPPSRWRYMRCNPSRSSSPAPTSSPATPSPQARCTPGWLGCWPTRPALRRSSSGRPTPVRPQPPVSAVASLAVLVVAGWFATPNLLRLSGDAGIVRYFDGTAKVLVDPRALARGEVSGAVRKDVPVTAGRIVRVVATNGTVAQVRDTWVLKDGRADWTSISELDQHDGVELGHVETSYAIDRRSMAAAASYPAGWRVTQHRGLAMDWPGGAAKKDYIGWVSDTRSTTTLRFAGQRQIEV